MLLATSPLEARKDGAHCPVLLSCWFRGQGAADAFSKFTCVCSEMMLMMVKEHLSLAAAAEGRLERSWSPSENRGAPGAHGPALT